MHQIYVPKDVYIAHHCYAEGDVIPTSPMYGTDLFGWILSSLLRLMEMGDDADLINTQVTVTIGERLLNIIRAL
jgi:hypothetical protein